MDLPTSNVCLALGVLGVLGHLMVFIKIDPIETTPNLALAALITPAILSLVLNTLLDYSPLQATLTAALWFSSYVGGVFLSMLIYRLFFHRLRHYPGPFLAKITQLHHIAMVFERADHFRYLDKLHQQYGEYVRIGPNKLSIADPDIVDIAHGPNTKFNKAEWYQAGKPLTTLHQMTDRALHDKRRRHGWEKVG